MDMNLFGFVLRPLPQNLCVQKSAFKVLTMFSLETFCTYTKKKKKIMFCLINQHFHRYMCVDMFMDDICVQLFVLGHILYAMAATPFLQDVHVACIMVGCCQKLPLFEYVRTKLVQWQVHTSTNWCSGRMLFWRMQIQWSGNLVSQNHICNDDPRTVRAETG